MPATTLQCNSANDLFLTDGRNLTIIPAGQNACAQNALQATLMYKGENPYNTQEGVDYFGTLFTSVVDWDSFRLSLQTTLENVPDVLDVAALTIQQVVNPQFPNSQSLEAVEFSATLNTAYGPTVVTAQTST